MAKADQIAGQYERRSAFARRSERMTGSICVADFFNEFGTTNDAKSWIYTAYQGECGVHARCTLADGMRDSGRYDYVQGSPVRREQDARPSDEVPQRDDLRRAAAELVQDHGNAAFQGRRLPSRPARRAFAGGRQFRLASASGYRQSSGRLCRRVKEAALRGFKPPSYRVHGGGTASGIHGSAAGSPLFRALRDAENLNASAAIEGRTRTQDLSV